MPDLSLTIDRAAGNWSTRLPSGLPDSPGGRNRLPRTLGDRRSVFVGRHQADPGGCGPAGSRANLPAPSG